MSVEKITVALGNFIKQVGFPVAMCVAFAYFGHEWVTAVLSDMQDRLDKSEAKQAATDEYIRTTMTKVIAENTQVMRRVDARLGGVN